jgi:hypothetical protein
MFSKEGKRVTSVIVGCALAAYSAGQHFEVYPGPTPKTLLNIATAASTSSVSVVGMNLTSFAEIKWPPVVPPSDRFEQG